jgi:aryl-alcohol dehydrogenase-like predicted oxidoreductase
MGLTGVYNASVPEDVAISLIKHAFSKGITFFDTSDLYGPHVNEVLLGKVLLYYTITSTSATIYLYIFFWFSTM